MYLKEGKLGIRIAVERDAGLLCTWWNDGAIMAHAGFPNGLGTTEEVIQGKIEQQNDDHQRLILEYENTPIGEMNYRKISDGVFEMGIKICVAAEREKGYGTTYIRMLLDELFYKKGARKVVLDTNVENKRAQHVYEKVGFRQVALRENAWEDQLGRLQSFVEYELEVGEYTPSP